MSQEPLISILVPVYNAQSFLQGCLESVLSQTYNNLEIICIDDGSTDQSVQILEQYSKKDNRVHLICQTHQGIASTRNHLLQAANGEYIAFVDADDKIAPTYIEELLKVAKEKNADVVRARYYLWEGETITPCEEVYKEFLKKEPSKRVKQRMQAALDDSQVWLKLIKTSLIRDNKIKFLEGSLAEDISFEFLIYLYAKKILFINTWLYYYRTGHENSLSNNKSELAFGTVSNLIFLSEELISRKFTQPEIYNFVTKLIIRALGRIRKYNVNAHVLLVYKSIQCIQILANKCSIPVRIKCVVLCNLAAYVDCKKLPRLAWLVR